MSSTDTDTTTERAGRREWWGLAVLVVPIVLVSMDMSVLYLALPSLTEDLQPSSSQQLWILDIYSFMLAGLLVTMGSLGDRIGTRRLLMIGSLVFDHRPARRLRRRTQSRMRSARMRASGTDVLTARITNSSPP